MEIILIGSYCPSKTIICNVKDNLWLSDRINTFMEEKNALSKSFSKSN